MVVSGVSRRRVVVGMWSLMAVALSVGCAASGAEDEPGASAGWAPVTTEGAFGSAEIVEAPVDVLALSPTDADILLSLGVVPSAVPSSAQTDAATGGTGMYPWQVELYPVGTSKLMLDPQVISVEQIAAQDPDLIVATTLFGLDQGIYDQLSAIAPVVHFDSSANADPWEESARKVAAAVGRSAEAEEAIAAAEASLGRVRAENPGLEGVTYNAVISPTPATLSILCSDEDNLARVLAAVGMSVSEFATSVECAGGKQSLSWENVSMLDADVVWAIPDTEGQMEELAVNPSWTGLDAVREGRVVVVPKTTGVPFALAFPSPLSVQWAAEQMVPQFAEVAGN